jgi:hypothetical protein
MTAVPQIQWNPTGLVLPTEPAILTGCQQDLNAAFGGNLNPALNTPQGQWATSEAAIIANANASIANIVNGVNPATSSGFMQDAIGRLYFLTRNPGLPTTVTATCIGLPGTVIPVGAQAADTSGNLYVCTGAQIIPIGGSVSAQFQNVVLGPIACPANTLTTIYQSIPGWDTVNNAGAGVLGANVETPAAFEFRREQTIAANSNGALQSVYGAVFALPGIVDVFAVENATTSAITGAIGGNPNSTSYSVAANSIYVAVVGGTQSQIAQAIWTKKSPGCNTDGNTSTTVTDTNYSLPQPSYTIKYNTPTNTNIYFAATLASNSGLPGNYKTLIQNAIIAQFLGQTGNARARIGSQILAANYYGAVLALGAIYQLTSIVIGFTSSPASSSLQMGIDQMPVTIAANITVSP